MWQTVAAAAAEAAQQQGAGQQDGHVDKLFFN